MSAQQRKSVEVILDVLHSHIPASRCVALRAIGAHLAAVNIRVAIRAILAHVREDWLHVAFRASYFFVHAAEGIPCGVVIEFRDGADRCPACGGMAVFTRDIQRSVRALGRLLLSIRSPNKCKRHYQERYPTSDLENSDNKNPLMPSASSPSAVGLGAVEL